MAAFLIFNKFYFKKSIKAFSFRIQYSSMKKIFIAFILTLTLQSSQAQLLQLQDPVSSKNFNPDKYAGIRGTPLFQDKWIHGSVITSKGIYPDLELKIDQSEEKILILDEKLKSVVELINTKLDYIKRDTDEIKKKIEQIK